MKPRLNLMMTEKSKQRLDRLVSVTEAESGAEVVRNALQLYEVMINHTIGDKEFLIRDKKSGEITLYSPFLSVEVGSQQPNPSRGRDDIKQSNVARRLGGLVTALG